MSIPLCSMAIFGSSDSSRRYRLNTWVMFLTISQCCNVFGTDLFPSTSLKKLQTECAAISVNLRKTAPDQKECTPLIDEDGEASCKCDDLHENIPHCPDHNGGNRFIKASLISRDDGAQRLCKYRQEDTQDCEIEWQDVWRCESRNNLSMGLRKGILITSPGLRGVKCYDKYLGFSKCSKFGYCEEVKDRICNLVTQHDYKFYTLCNGLVGNIHTALCKEHDHHYDGWKSSCRAEEFETIICTPRITFSGQLRCECMNPYKSMKGREDALANDTCPTVPTDGYFWNIGWRSYGTCIFSYGSDVACKINWVAQIVASVLTNRSHGQSCTEPDKENGTMTMLVGKIERPHDVTGLTCDQVYNASIVCDGLWCLQVCTNYPSFSKRLMFDERGICRAFAKGQAERLRKETKQSECWGCVTRQDDGICVSAPSDGIRRCKCILLFNPDFLLQVTNQQFKDYTPGWLNGGYPFILPTFHSSSGKRMQFLSEGKRFVTHFGQSDACRDESCFVSYYEAFERTELQPKIDWSAWKCIGDGSSEENRIGNLSALAGLKGYQAYHGKHKQVSCLGYRCWQLRMNYSECGPTRRLTLRHRCRCKLNWTRQIGKYGNISCGAEHQGCCNPVGEPSRIGYCPIEPGSCTDGQPEDASDQKDDCIPPPKDVNECYPWWFLDKSSKCPYGQALLGDVTLPTRPGVTDVISVIYGYIPFVVAICALLEFIIRRGTRSLSFLFFVLFIVAMGEVFFKRLANQPRPPLTCLHSCGMPSSHSSLSVGYFVIMFADAAWRQFKVSGNRESLRKSWTVVPLLHSDTDITPRKFIGWVGFWFCILVPVPVTRVLLHDHTPAQVLAGSLIGFVEALIWFGFMLTFEKRAKDRFGESKFGITHDLELTAGSRARLQRFESELSIDYNADYTSRARLHRFGTETTLPPQFPRA